MQTIIALIAVLLIGSAQASGQVYKVVDEEGRVTYTDSPPADEEAGESVQVPEVNTQPAVKPRPDQDSQATADKGAGGYRDVYIAQPAHESTVPPGQLDVVVQVVTDPALKPSHRVQVFYDGEPYAPPAATTSVVLSELYRGTHQIRAQIIDADNRVVASTEPVTIYVKRHSIQHPNPAPYPGAN